MNWSASFILNTPRDAFRQWADGALQPLMHSREIRLYETLSHGVADLHWTTEEDASWWIETYELGPERTEVTAWFDPRIDRWDLSLWTFILALDVIFTRFQDACLTLEWQPNDTDSETGAIFTGAMQRLRAGNAGAQSETEQFEPARDDGAKAKRGAPKLSQREPEEGQIEAMKKYRKECDAGKSKTVAAGLAGVPDYRTVEGWLEAWSQYIE